MESLNFTNKECEYLLDTLNDYGGTIVIDHLEEGPEFGYLSSIFYHMNQHPEHFKNNIRKL